LQRHVAKFGLANEIVCKVVLIFFDSAVDEAAAQTVGGIVFVANVASFVVLYLK
jgi:hypothetical protein